MNFIIKDQPTTSTLVVHDNNRRKITVNTVHDTFLALFATGPPVLPPLLFFTLLVVATLSLTRPIHFLVFSGTLSLFEKV